MKKQLLVGAFLLASFFTANAQVISFETSEGFTLGNINGQQNWSLYSTATPATAGVVTDAVALDGSNSLQLVSSNSQPENYIGVVGPLFDSELLPASYDVNFSVYTDAIDAEGGSDGLFWGYNLTEESAPAAYLVYFNYTGTIRFGTGLNASNQVTLATETVPFEAATWYNIKVRFTETTVAYYVNDELIVSADLIGGNRANVSSFIFDDWGTSYNVDSYSFSEATAGVNENTLANLSVYPNPVNDVVNVSVDALVSNVAIVDLNGRTVKTAKFDGVANASVNVSDLASGIYMMTITSDKGATTKKIVKN
ncbi:MAG: hypothetical protein DI539_06900 [Flavobacterium psychrophilum]|nr:MAG: hypothetical protein DI539_06900 [Flavobacterium psychrophilum]